ncbi:hypothetical protein STRATTON_189 [Erwinia phage vB_EamM_Stratton]|uniref:Virion structural protein n=1 Tax=Erwinia phage vB_EamM_Stratton TaxID=1883378 RepID=A0A1B2IHA8_9CAUD|nr:hypothetical protein STRATTON_189 [Erwinia phage vB_EamM_Stratton]
MAVVLDPHFKEPGNMQTGEAVTLIGTTYKMLVPAYAPFYTTSLVVKSGGKVLTLGDDYVITHPYMMAMLRTGYVSHGMIWVTNPKYYKDFTVDYHAVGNGIATQAQITAERTANAGKFPSLCQWEEVIGDVYFPPVDIQFDRENWRGELELMEAIAAIGKKIGTPPPIPDPYLNNIYAPVFPDIFMSNGRSLVDYDQQGGYKAKSAGSIQVYHSSNDYLLKNFQYDTTYTMPGYATNANAKTWGQLILASWASPYQNIGLAWDSTTLVMSLNVTIANTAYPVASFAAPKSFMAGKFRVQWDRNYDLDTVHCIVSDANGAKKMDFLLDLRNPPAALVAPMAANNTLAILHRGTDVRTVFTVVKGDSWRHAVFPGMTVPDGSDVLTLLKEYHAIVRKLYDDAPAHAHVPRKDNPHNDSWGAIRALELNGIASDATLVYGRTQAQLADYINNLLPKLSNLANKLLRNSANPQAINGTFGTKPGLTSVTSVTGATETGGVGAQFTVDPKVIRFLGRDSQTVNAGNNPITFQSGANQLILYPDSRGLLWNGKKLLDPTTVGPYLPGVTGGGNDGLFYGTNTATVTINGNGIQSVPFICTFVPPTSADVNILAMRSLANDFGTAEDLAATPALIAKLDAMFTGKLEKVKAYINDLPLTSSVFIDKLTFNLDKVVNTADVDLPVSTLQSAEMAKYAVVGHTHAAAVFGVKAATATQFGLIQYGLAVDNATLALDGSVVIDQTTRIGTLEATAKGVDSAASVNILRFGVPGSNIIQNGATVTGWMVTLAEENYFVGQLYKAPLTTVNLTEAFPDAYEDTTFGIFVDIADGAAKYYILANPDTAETDTMTKVGTIDTSEDGIEIAEIHNVTRLGDYRELEEHKANDNAHIRRTMSMADFGYTLGYGKGGPCWSSGVPNASRGEADWRMGLVDQYWPMSGMLYDSQTSRWEFDPAGVTMNDYRFIHHTFPLYRNAGITHSWALADQSYNTLLESIVAGWHDKDNFFNRVSILMSRGTRIADSNGLFCYAGLGINFGAGRNVVIGFTPMRVASPAPAWTELSPSLTFSNSRATDGTLTITCVLTMASLVYDIVLTLGEAVKTVKCTARAAGTTQTIDLSNRIRPDYLDISALWKEPTTPVYQGLGGLFNASTRATVTHPADTTYTRFFNATFLDYLANFSVLNRARFLEFNYVGGDSTLETLAMTIADAERTLVQNVNVLPIPTQVNEERVIAYCQNNLARAAIFRD